jgi:hypothetical protein
MWNWGGRRKNIFRKRGKYEIVRKAFGVMICLHLAKSQMSVFTGRSYMADVRRKPFTNFWKIFCAVQILFYIKTIKEQQNFITCFHLFKNLYQCDSWIWLKLLL